MAGFSGIQEVDRLRFVRYHSDGLIDLFVGWVLAVGWLELVSGAFWVSFAVILPAFGYFFMKRRVTARDLGPEERQSLRRVNLAATTSILAALTFLLALLVLLVARGVGESAFPRRHIGAVFGVLVALITVGFAELTRIRRYRFYGLALILLTVLLAVLRHNEFQGLFLWGGVVFLLGGVLRLNRFMKYLADASTPGDPPHPPL